MLSKTETLLLAAFAALIALAVLGPAITRPDSHQFADGRALWGIPFAMDVLSNLPFAGAGLAGAWYLWRLPQGAIGNGQQAMAALFFAGLVLTAVASFRYHLGPDDAGLAVDRCAMAVAFAGLLGLAAGRISQRAGVWLGLAVLVLGPLAVLTWSLTGNLLPWAAVQFGGLVLVGALTLMRSCDSALDIRWAFVILAYAAAKLSEANDHAIFQLTGEAVSGHTLKHAVAAFAAWPVIAATGRLRDSRQNCAGSGRAKAC